MKSVYSQWLVINTIIKYDNIIFYYYNCCESRDGLGDEARTFDMIEVKTLEVDVTKFWPREQGWS